MCPSSLQTGWELESAEERAAAFPDRFHIPSRDERDHLRVGDRVKLLFLFQNEENGEPILDCERMWVRVTNASQQAYAGVLESSPVTSELVEAGASIQFGPEHVATIAIGYTDPRHPLYAPTPFRRSLKRLRFAFSCLLPRSSRPPRVPAGGA